MRPSPPRQESAYRSPFDLAFAPDGRRLAVSDRTAGCLYVLDAQTGDISTTIRLRSRPSALAWESAERVVVSEYGDGSVAQVDVQKGRVLQRFDVGPKPVGVAVAAGKGLLVVCDFGLHTVSILDLKTGNLRATIPAGRHPYFAAITPDERTAIIGNLLPSGPAVEHASASVISLIDLDAGTKIRDIPLPDNSANVRQVRVSPDGRWAYVVHTRGRTMLPTTQLDRGWINTNALSILDLAGGQLYATLLLDTVTAGAADPWGIAISPDGKTTWISIAGAHEIARIDLGRLHELLAGKADARVASAQIGDAADIWRQIQADPGKRDQLSYHLSALYAADLIAESPSPPKDQGRSRPLRTAGS